MDFPLKYIPDAKECYNFLLRLLHEGSMKCPNGHSLEDCYIYKRTREPILDYRCKVCGKCFNIFSGTILQGTKYSLIQIIQYTNGLIQNVPISQISREIGVGRKGLTTNKPKFKILAEKAKTIEAQYINWDDVFKDLDLTLEYGGKIKAFIGKIASHKPHFLYWEAFLQNIEDWEVESTPGDNNTSRLILKMKGSGAYEVSKISYFDINPKSGKRIHKRLNRVQKLSSTYLIDKRRNK
jgi:transposase-like protein